MNDDIVIAASDRYGWPQLRNWVLSLADTGFGGRVVIVAYRIDEDTVGRLSEHGVEIVRASSDHLSRPIDYRSWERRALVPNRLRRLWKLVLGTDVPHIGHNAVFHFRFFHYWQFLATTNHADAYVVASDVSDVVFQKNPSIWLRNNAAPFKLISSSESLRHCDEPWNCETFSRCYGSPILNRVLRDRLVSNAGVVAGEAAFVRDLFLNVYLMTFASAFSNSDQAAMNLLLSLEPNRSEVRVTTSHDAWACQAGTTADPRKIVSFRPHLRDPEPYFRDGLVYNAAGTKYCIVHQYNRVPEWKLVIDARYAARDREGLSVPKNDQPRNSSGVNIAARIALV